MESQAIQVNLPYEVADFGCQVNTRGIQLMMKSVHTQTPLVFISETSTQYEEGDIPEEKGTIAKEAVGTLSPEVSPQKDGAYLPSTSNEMSDDSNLSESEDEDETPKVLTHKMILSLSSLSRNCLSFSSDALSVVPQSLRNTILHKGLSYL